MILTPYGNVVKWHYDDRRGLSDGTRNGAVMPCRAAHSSTASMMRSWTFTFGPRARAYRFNSYLPSGCRYRTVGSDRLSIGLRRVGGATAGVWAAPSLGAGSATRVWLSGCSFDGSAAVGGASLTALP